MKRLWRFIILAVIGFALGGGLAYIQGVRDAEKAAVVQEVKAPVAVASEEPAPVPAQEEVAGTAALGGAFDLVDHNGQAVTQASWPGKFKLLFFGFTHCPDVCPAAMDKLDTVLEALGTDAEKVQVLFITTDPARDTSEAMKAYLANYHASILGLTGTEEQIKRVVDVYKVYAAKVEGVDPENYMMDHSAYMYLMTEDDKALEIFRGEDTAEMLVEKIKAHLPASSSVSVEVPVAEVPAAVDAPAMVPDAEIPVAAETEVPAVEPSPQEPAEAVQ